MTTIDLIVLGILTTESLSAYDIQKLVEFRQISQWVKISTPSIYKKVIQLESKEYIVGKNIKEGNFAEKTVYSLTPKGRATFEKLMVEISAKPINMFLDFNSVIVNLMSLEKEQQQICITNIKENIGISKKMLKENIEIKEQLADIPKLGMAVLYQQYALIESLEKWINSL